MSKVEYSVDLVATATPDALQRCAEALAESGWEVERPSASACSATRGSQVRARLFGTWALRVGPEDLPQHVAIEASTDGLRVTLRDSLGIGWMDHRTREKYAIAFAGTEEILRAAVA